MSSGCHVMLLGCNGASRRGEVAAKRESCDTATLADKRQGVQFALFLTGSLTRYTNDTLANLSSLCHI